MKPVTVGRYEEGLIPPGRYHPDDAVLDGGVGWKGYVCTEDWIIFEHEDGRLFVWRDRDPETGAVTGEPTII